MSLDAPAQTVLDRIAKSGRPAVERLAPNEARDLSRLPPALIIAAGFDPLLDAGKAYADRLNASGVPANYRCFAGQIHGFITMGKVIDDAGRALDVAGAAVKAALGA